MDNTPAKPRRKRHRRYSKESHRCDPEQIQRAKQWREEFEVSRLLRGIPPDGIDPAQLKAEAHE